MVIIVTGYTLIEAFRHLVMSQQGEKKTKSVLDFHV